jgi:diguanylate cyclase (GGDEF)-like protein
MHGGLTATGILPESGVVGSVEREAPGGVLAALAAAEDVVVLVDAASEIVIWASEGFAHVTGIAAASVQGSQVDRLACLGLDGNALPDVRDALERGERYEEHTFGHRWDGSPLRLDMRVVRLPDEWRPGTWLIAARDVTRHHAELAELVETAAGGVEPIAGAFEEIGYAGELRPDGRLVSSYVGPGLDQLLGISFRDAEHPESLWRGMIHPEDRPLHLARDEALRRGEAAEVEYRLVWPDGTVRTILERMRPTLQSDGSVLVNGVVIDVSGSRETSAQLVEASAMLTRVVEAIDEYLYTVEIEGDRLRSVWRGPGRTRILGGADPLRRDPDNEWEAAIHVDDRAVWDEAVARMALGEPAQLEYRLIGHDGRLRWVWDRSYPRREGGRIYHDGIVTDITERRALSDRLLESVAEANAANAALEAQRAEAELLSRTDALTGTANRRFFAELLDVELVRLARGGPGSAVLLIDVDHFKHINDAYGHHTGDRVLGEVAARIRAAVREEDTVARWGGEEFAVLVRDLQDNEALRRIGEAIRRSVGYEALMAGDDPVSVTISCGAVRLSVDHVTLEAAMNAADQALYSAKRHGRNQVRLYHELSLHDLVAEVPEAVHLARTLALVTATREGLPVLQAARIADLSARVAERLGATAALVFRARLAGWLHDIGKVVVPDQILMKPGPLDDAEWSVVRSHPGFGEQIVRRIGGLSEAAAGVRHHHERWDGTGYPDRLSGDEIPLEARIVAAVDAYTAMTTNRAHQPSRAPREALAELGRHAGTQLDPTVVTALGDALDDEDARRRRLSTRRSTDAEPPGR